MKITPHGRMWEATPHRSNILHIEEACLLQCFFRFVVKSPDTSQVVGSDGFENDDHHDATVEKIRIPDEVIPEISSSCLRECAQCKRLCIYVRCCVCAHAHDDVCCLLFYSLPSSPSPSTDPRLRSFLGAFVRHRGETPEVSPAFCFESVHEVAYCGTPGQHRVDEHAIGLCARLDMSRIKNKNRRANSGSKSAPNLLCWG